MTRVFISYRHVSPDEELAAFLAERLDTGGAQVFLDKQMLVGTKWVEEIHRRIGDCDYFVVLLSAESIRSDMVRQEVKLAHDLFKAGQRPVTLPVRVAFRGELPYDLGAYLDPIQYAVWEEGEPFQRLAKQVEAAVGGAAELPERGKGEDDFSATGVRALFNATDARGAPLPQADPRLALQLDLDTGTVRLDSPFYIEREADGVVLEQVERIGTTTIVKGPRQIGKSSLLARAFAAARRLGQRTYFLDFQLIDTSNLDSLDALFLYMARKLARAFKTGIKPDDLWDENLGATDNMTDFLEEAVLAADDSPVLLVLDEADLVFRYAFKNDFFSTIRGWHNRRALDPEWNKLSLLISHSTEPYLWIEDIHQSPFNVGLRQELAPFTVEQVAMLNGRHGNPLKDENEIRRLVGLVGGQPYLVRQTLYTLVTNEWGMSDLEGQALEERGPFGDHLRRYLWGLQKAPELEESLRQILRQGRCDDEMHFHRLRAAGLVRGTSRNETEMSCTLFTDYFKRHL